MESREESGEPLGTLWRITGRFPRIVSWRSCEAIFGRVSGGIPRKMIGATSEKISGAIPEENFGRIPERTPKVIPGGIPRSIHGKFSG